MTLTREIPVVFLLDWSSASRIGVGVLRLAEIFRTQKAQGFVLKELLKLPTRGVALTTSLSNPSRATNALEHVEHRSGFWAARPDNTFCPELPTATSPTGSLTKASVIAWQEV